MGLNSLTLIKLRQLIDRGEVRPHEILIDVFKRIQEVEDKVRAYISLATDKAYEMAKDSEEYIFSGKTSFLTGIPIAIKDNICTRNIFTTCASKILYNFRPPYESTVTSRLLKERYILVGKTNMDEFAMGSSTENSGFHITKNPWNLECVPGGSSGGSAAAVSADECIAALGSDTGGSIRQPASFCGVVGLKPTYGMVSRFGLVAFASSLDQIGPITKCVADSAILMNVIAGNDPMDSTSVPLDKIDFTESLGRDVKGFRIGIPKEYFIEGMDKDVEERVREAIAQLEALGCIPVEISLPHTEYAVATYYIVATSEASSNLARYDGVKYGLRVEGKDLLDMYMKTRSRGFGAEVKRRIMLGTYSLSAGYYDAYYKKALQVRNLIRKDFESAFKDVDFIVTPTSPSPAFKIGEKVEDPLQMYLSDIFTISVNLAGLPAISIPCGFSLKGLPIGFQIIGKPFDERGILQLAYAYEQSTPWHKMKPMI